MIDKSIVPSFEKMMKPILKVLSEAQALDNDTIESLVFPHTTPHPTSTP